MYESLAHAMLDALTAMSPNASATVCASLRRSGSMGVSSKLATASASPGSVALIATPLRLYATTSKVAHRQGSLTRTRILFHSRCFRHRVWASVQAARIERASGFASRGRPGRRPMALALAVKGVFQQLRSCEIFSHSSSSSSTCEFHSQSSSQLVAPVTVKTRSSTT